MLSALVFGTNLVRLVDTPSEYGQTWNFSLDADFAAVPERSSCQNWRQTRTSTPIPPARTARSVSADKSWPRWASTVSAATSSRRCSQGRPPASPDEIVLGTRTLRRMHRSVGQSTPVQLANGQRTMRVVGRAVFPNLGRGDFTPTGLGEGAAVVASLLPANAGGGPSGPGTSYNFYLVRLRPGATPPRPKPASPPSSPRPAARPSKTSCLSHSPATHRHQQLRAGASHAPAAGGLSRHAGHRQPGSRARHRHPPPAPGLRGAASRSASPPARCRPR